MVCGRLELLIVPPDPPTAVLMIMNIGVVGMCCVSVHVVLPSIFHTSELDVHTN